MHELSLHTHKLSLNMHTFGYNIRNLVVNNQYIESINLDQLSLEYVDLRSNYLRRVIYIKDTLLYCISNKIKDISINLKIFHVDKERTTKRSQHILLIKLVESTANECIPFVKYKIYNISYRFYIVERNIQDFKSVLACIFKDIRNVNLVNAVEYIYKKMYINKGFFHLICISKESMIIKPYIK